MNLSPTVLVSPRVNGLEVRSGKRDDQLVIPFVMIVETRHGTNITK